MQETDQFRLSICAGFAEHGTQLRAQGGHSHAFARAQIFKPCAIG